MTMLQRSTSITPERFGTISVGLAAAITSSLLSGWAPLSILGRAVVFFGSLAFGLFLARWTIRSSRPAAAFGKSLLAGALQANVAASALVVLAMAVDTIFGTAPSENRFHDVFAFMFLMLMIGSVVGLAIGVVYGFVPAYVVASRDERSHATLDRVLVANGAWLTLLGVAHLVLIECTYGRSSTKYDGSLAAASWAVPLILGAACVVAAFVRAKRRAAFVARVRAGSEPLYRIVPLEVIATDDLLPVDNSLPRTACRSALVRVAIDADAEHGYRTNALPVLEEPIALVG